MGAKSRALPLLLLALSCMQPFTLLLASADVIPSTAATGTADASSGGSTPPPSFATRHSADPTPEGVAAAADAAAAAAATATSTAISSAPGVHDSGTAPVDCDATLDAYMSRFARHPRPYTGNNIAFFLHLPRTAGRTLHTCFLKLGTPPHRRCPKAYDHLRINTSVPNCFLLSSHDDYSVLSLLPDDVAVLSHFRDPLDRFLSAYEFAIEIAARKLTSRPPQGGRADRTVTENVWPWSHLVPFFMEDMRARASALAGQLQGADEVAQGAAQPLRTPTAAWGVPWKRWGRRSNRNSNPNSNSNMNLDAGGRADAWAHVRHPDGDRFFYNAARGVSKWLLSAEEQEQEVLLPDLDPYSNPLAMSLEEFVEHPIARELLHDGQAYQVLGITNYSHWGEAGQLRHCVSTNRSTRQQLLDLALTRTQAFLHVGVTSRLPDSVAAAGSALGFDLEQAAYPSSGEHKEPAERLKEQQQLQRAVAAAEQRVRHSAHRLREVQRRVGKAQAGGGEAGPEEGAQGEEREVGEGVKAQAQELGGEEEGEGRQFDDAMANEHVEGVKEVEEARRKLQQAQGALKAARARVQTFTQSAAQQQGHQRGGQRQGLGQGQGQGLGIAPEAEDLGQPGRQVQGEGQGQGNTGGKEAGEQELQEQGQEVAQGQGQGQGQRQGQPEGGAKPVRASGRAPLALEYQMCAARAQQRSHSRRVRSLARWTMPDGRSIWFSKAARGAIPTPLLDRIRELNQLDAALYQQALQLLDASSERWAEDGRLQQLPPLPPPAPGAVEAEREKDRQTDEKLPFHIPKPVEGKKGPKDEL